MRLIVTVVAQLAMIFATARSQAAPDSPAAVHTRKTQFRIPYRYDADEMRKLGAREIRLYVSADQGNIWRHAQTVAPAAGRFDFAAPGEGEYWFSVRTVDGQGRLFPPGEVNRAGLKVVVDATHPRFEVTVRQLKPGRVQLSWRADDPHIDARTLRLEYLQTGSQQWQPVSVIPQAAGQTSWSVPQGGIVAVRGSISDMAANTARAEQRVQIDPAGPALRPPPVPNYNEPIAQRDETNRLTNTVGEPADSLPLITNRSAVADVSSRFVSSRDEEQPSLVAEQTPVSEREADIFLDASGNRIVRVDNFDIRYEIGEVGPSGVGAVEFYITRDGGGKWLKLGDDLDRRTPFHVKALGDGTYGFEIRVRSGVGLAADPPRPGDAPSIIVVVDQTPPVLQLYPAQQGQGASLNTIMIRWKAEDENPAARPIFLAYSPTPDGPWTTIRDWQKDTGSFLWRVTDDVAPRLYVAVSARDAAGNVRRAVTNKPIVVDLKKPSAKIVGVNSPASGERR